MIQEIRPRNSSLFAYLGELWSYRYLGILLTGRLLITRYKQTLLGPLWLIIQPIALTGAVTLLFQEILGQQTGDIPGTLFYYSGVILWMFFHRVSTKTSGVFLENAVLFRKVYFPRFWMPLANLLDGTLTLVIQMAVLVLVVLLTPDWKVFWIGWLGLLLPLFLTGLWALALGLLFASLSVRYRDFAQVFAFVLSLLLFLTPVYYPGSSVSGALSRLLVFNPLGPVFELWRAMMFSETLPAAQDLGINGLAAVLSVFLSLRLFIRMERRAMDVL